MLWTLGAALAADCEALDARVVGDCLTTALMALNEAGCATQLNARGLGLIAPRPPLPPPGPSKQTRDVYNVPNSAESENFVLYWGSGWSGDSADAVLQAVEDGWTVEIEDMGYPGPYGSDSYKFNVYVGSTGGGTPDDYGAAGYFYYDDDGWPMVVINESTVQDLDYGKTTAVHELFHAIQDVSGSNYGYGEGSPGAWFYEASASWIEVEVYPDNDGYAQFLFGYSFYPHLSINYFDYPDGGGLEQYHQYGAFVFIRYLAEHQMDWTLIQDAWLNGGDEEDPLEVMDQKLRANNGTTLRAAFFDFAGRNVAWEYEHGELYAEAHDAYADSHANSNNRVAAQHAGSTDGWATVEDDLLPWRLGTNYIRLDPSDRGPDLLVEFSGEAEGEYTSNAAWKVEVVVLREGLDPEHHDLELEAREGSVWVSDTVSADEVWVVVSVSTGEEIPGEAFAYTYAMEPGTMPEDTGIDIGETISELCACGTGPRQVGWMLAVSGLLLVIRRR